MPFPNEHAARQEDPDRFKRFRRRPFPGDVKGIDVVWGVRPDDKTEIQSFRFNKKLWTVGRAKGWLKDKGFKTVVEAATEE